MRRHTGKITGVYEKCVYVYMLGIKNPIEKERRMLSVMWKELQVFREKATVYVCVCLCV